MGKFKDNLNDDDYELDVPDHAVLRQVIAKLDQVKACRPSNRDIQFEAKALCPVHDDHNPSLSIALWKSGTITVKCWTDCEESEVLDALGVTKNQLTVRGRKRGNRRKMVAAYAYHDEAGAIRFRAVRYDPKGFGMQQPDGRGGWTNNIQGVRRVLFNLPAVIAAIAAGSPIFVVEGEKDARRLAKSGLVATTNIGGANKWLPEYSESLRGAHVVIIPDNDKAGRDHANLVAGSLNGVAATVKILSLEGLAEKGDVTDWLDQGHTIAELSALAEKAAKVDIDAPPSKSIDESDRERYAETPQGFMRAQRNGEWGRMSNYTASITRVMIEDDGAERTVLFEVTATHAGRTNVFKLSPSEFYEMRWHVSNIGALAAIMPFANPQEVRYAIQLFSKYETVTIPTHIGWHITESAGPVYVHAGGAIGAKGVVEGLRPRLDQGMAAYSLPAPPAGEDVHRAVRQSLHFLKVAPLRITVPMLGAAFRAPLGTSDFSLQLAGTTGVGKTELAARMQQFYGSKFGSRNLPASWTSTANAIEAVAFTAKDAIVVVDDLAPRGSDNNIRQLQQVVDRVFRNQGNGLGRQRMRADTTLRPPKPPRGLPISTGEDVATGRSATARTLILDVEKDDVNWDQMTIAQANGAAGEYAAAMSAYIQFLARHFAEIEASRLDALNELRRLMRAGEHHARMPDIVANLLLGWRWFLRFATESNALTSVEAAEYERAALEVLIAVANAQSVYQVSENQARMFLKLVAAALDSGMYHLTDLQFGRPSGWARLGWQRVETSHDITHRPMGTRIGYVDGDDVLLIPEAAYRAAQAMAQHSPQSLTVSERTLHKNLFEEGLLTRTEVRDGKRYYVARKEFGGSRQALLHIAASSLGLDVNADDDPM
jgi:5S rRNA maturation endonuclease (ribonuclease M5)